MPQCYFLAKLKRVFNKLIRVLVLALEVISKLYRFTFHFRPITISVIMNCECEFEHPIFVIQTKSSTTRPFTVA